MRAIIQCKRWLWVIPALLMQFGAHANSAIQTSPVFDSNTLVAAAKQSTKKQPTKAKAKKKRTRASAVAATPSLSDIRSNAVLVFDESDSSVVYARRSDRVMPIASITKLMTAMVVLDGQQPFDDVLTITGDDRDTIHGSTSRLTIGTKLSRGDLLHLALMSSENRAAHALGRNYPGGLSAFIRTMNLKAKALGMDDTHFADPTGLSSENVSTASDLAKLVIASSRDPDIRRFSTDERYTVHVGRHPVEFRNTNSLVAKSDWDITVQKTGYTADAGRCLVMKSVIRDRPVVMVLLNSSGKYTRVADASRIRKWLEANPDAATRLASR